MLKYCNRNFYETLIKINSFIHSDQECFTQRHSGWIALKCPNVHFLLRMAILLWTKQENSVKPALLSKLEPAIWHRHSNFFSQNGPVRFLRSFKKKSHLPLTVRKEIWRSPDPYIRPVWKTKLQVELDQEPQLLYSGCRFFFVWVYSVRLLTT